MDGWMLNRTVSCSTWKYFHSTIWRQGCCLTKDDLYCHPTPPRPPPKSQILTSPFSTMFIFIFPHVVKYRPADQTGQGQGYKTLTRLCLSSCVWIQSIALTSKVLNVWDQGENEALQMESNHTEGLEGSERPSQHWGHNQFEQLDRYSSLCY